MFDITDARIALQAKRSDLAAECEANLKLQRRFDSIQKKLRQSNNHDGLDSKPLKNISQMPAPVL